MNETVFRTLAMITSMPGMLAIDCYTSRMTRSLNDFMLG